MRKGCVHPQPTLSKSATTAEELLKTINSEITETHT